ncbi:MAG: NUDIX domain-containing protein [Promicromonosporaceae bacterium]|nr:NUDIX domain-containing protein [Promicromonosporaceae bacterium]
MGAEQQAQGALGPDWVTAPDGVRSRRAARVLILDDDGRALLVRGHDADQPSRSWWFTVGGGIAAGETPVEAAARELFEETGLRLSPADLQGPILTREGLFHFFAETCRQVETFFLARVPAGWEPSQAGWTTQERHLLDELAWFTSEELRAQPREYFPRALPDVIEAIGDRWDGSVRHLGPEDDDAPAG